MSTRRELFLGLSASVLPELDPPVKVSVFTYHEIDYQKFKAGILNLIRVGWQPITVETFINVLEGRQKINPGLGVFLVTFDDSLSSQYNQGLKAIDEIKRETGWFIPIVFFTITKFGDPEVPLREIETTTPCYNDSVHSYMSLRELVQILKRGHSIQNHTVNHPDLTRLTLDACEGEIKTSEERIEVLYKLAGQKRNIKLFAYPYGRYKNINKVIASFGFDVAFTTQGGSYHRKSEKFSLPRFSRS